MQTQLGRGTNQSIEVMEEQLVKDLWSMVLSGHGSVRDWKLHDIEWNPFSFHVSGSKYAGRVSFIAGDSVNEPISVEFASDDNPTECITLAHITVGDMMRVMENSGSIPSEDEDRFKKEFGFK